MTRGGVVISIEGEIPSVGEEVVVWFDVNQKTWSLVASVLRLGVGLPERTQAGVALGFLCMEQRSREPDWFLHCKTAVLLPSGSVVNLDNTFCLDIRLDMESLVLVMRPQAKLLLVELGRYDFLLSTGDVKEQVGYEVRCAHQSRNFLVYLLQIVHIPKVDSHRQIVEGFRKR